MGRVDRDLIVGCVTMLDAKIEKHQFDIEIGLDQLLFDHVPDDASHLVAMKVGDRVLHFDLVHASVSNRNFVKIGSETQSPPPPVAGRRSL